MPQQTLNLPQLTIAATEQERDVVVDLLKQHGLPTSDINDDTLLYLLFDAGKPVGTAGLEIFEDCALLRSVSVVKNQQRKGYGKLLNQQIEQYARESGIECMYLLTTTAKDFFDRQGYCVIERSAAPVQLRHTPAFSSLCAEATLMKKQISPSGPR
jgi:amino-acid N-acetyltransferase